jgi:hypothetical protein
MAHQAVEQHKTPREWSLDDYLAQLIATSGCKRHEALSEMWERIAIGRVPFFRQRLVDGKPYNPWDRKPYSKEVVDPEDFSRGYKFDFTTVGGRVRVWPSSDDGFEYRYTVAELPWPASQTAAQRLDEDKTGADRSLVGLPTSATPKRVYAKDWIPAEAIRLKKDNKIPLEVHRRPTDFARFLEGHMRKAKKTNELLQPVGWPYIKNHLREWGIWPIESIKIT